jgi:hypothetical protein
VDAWEAKGTLFELRAANLFQRVSGTTVITHFDVFSALLGVVSPIDVLVVRSDAIYVLELKNIDGYLDGRYSDRLWLATSGSRKYRIFSPIVQVKEKLRSLKRLFIERGLDVGRYVWNGRVVVPDGCKILADPTVVVYCNDVIHDLQLVPAGQTDAAILQLIQNGSGAYGSSMRPMRWSKP